jgi:undecaprenyl diphosphate synthase
MIRWLYEKALARQISTLPSHICFMINEQDVIDAPGRMYDVTCWCREISEKIGGYIDGVPERRHVAGIQRVTFHVSTRDSGRVKSYLEEIQKIGRIARLNIHMEDQDLKTGQGMEVLVAIGKSGRDEIVHCLKEIAREGIPPEDVTEEVIEEHLTFPYNPDLVIKTGGSHLTDFLIWQSVYSELFFLDVNWRWFRKVDFFRALRDYQSRARRFGK